MFTHCELQTYHKVRRYLKDGQRQDLKAVHLRVHRDDIDKLRAYADDLNRQRWPELVHQSSQPADRPFRIGKHEEALLARLAPGDLINECELRELLYARISTPSSRRQTFIRTMRGLQKKQLLQHVSGKVWRRAAHPADAQPDCDGQASG
jgi:hypothetical protein